MEIWKDVPEYEGLYVVSNYGIVKSINRVVEHSNGQISIYKERILAQEKIKGNYKRVSISKENITKRYMVHRLVAICFLSNPENKPCVNHKDGNPNNNNVENLEWVTYSENERHSYDILGKINGNRKLTNNDIKYIKKNCIKGINKIHCNSTGYIAKKLNVDKSTILNVLNNRYYI